MKFTESKSVYFPESAVTGIIQHNNIGSHTATNVINESLNTIYYC